MPDVVTASVKGFVLHGMESTNSHFCISFYDENHRTILIEGDDKIFFPNKNDWPSVLVLVRFLTGLRFRKIGPEIFETY